MKRFYILTFLLSLVISAKAQEASELKPLKVDVSLGYAGSKGEGNKAGLLFVVEPKYAVIPSIAVGLKLETAIFIREYTNSSGSKNTEIKGAGSYVATADYYVLNNYSFRPFVGAGGGIYTLAAGTTDNGEVLQSGRKLGAMFRTGFEAKHFRLGFEYNLLPNSVYKDAFGTTGNISVENSYIGLKLGVVFGGGPR